MYCDTPEILGLGNYNNERRPPCLHSPWHCRALPHLYGQLYGLALCGQSVDQNTVVDPYDFLGDHDFDFEHRNLTERPNKTDAPNYHPFGTSVTILADARSRARSKW
jgi:hypothetical protein